ncbi:MAG: alcohol dehydrogenase [Desulfobacterales bacterium]|nr:MAG: alcohol dehydrogenase [Desulfobacterales bacterium]
MKAFVMQGIGKVGIVDKPIPEPGPNDAVIKTTTALVCTSDVHTVAGAIGDRYNLTLGHEGMGVVYKLGSEVKGFKEGDRVVINAITPCYQCTNCQRGFTSQCEEALGGWKYANIKDGCFAEYFHVNDAKANMVKVPDDVTDEQALYTTDMMSTGFMGAEHANIPLGGTVAVFGQGPVGLMATAGAKLLGAGLIIGVECVPERQKLSRQFGADEIVDFTKVDTIEEIMRLTDGEGVDSAIEALGSQITFENCVKATRPGGTISNAGYHGDGDYVKIPRAEWGVGMADKTIRTGLCPGGSERMGRLLRLLQRNRIDPTAMTTHRFPFDEIEKGYLLMKTKEDNVLKPLIEF